MPPPVPRRLAPTRARALAWLGGAAVLAACLGATLVGGALYTSAVGSDPAAPERAREDAFAQVAEALARVLGDMGERSDRVAEVPQVRAALDAADDTLAAERAAFDALGALRLSARDAVEIYAPSGRLVAWSGLAFPRRAGAPPDSFLTRTVLDGGGRRALVLWRPVYARDGGAPRVVGSVRVVRLAQASVPVRNRYLQDYDLADEWRPSIDRPFAVLFRPTRRPPTPEARRLLGPAGSHLGWVDVPPPPPPALQVSARRTVGDLVAFWSTLLMGWALAGLAGWFLLALRRAEVVRREGAWTSAVGAFAALAAGIVAARYGLLALDVPVRWLDAARRPAALFDPTVLASPVGGGVLRSAGDLALTAVLAYGVGGAALALGLRYAAAAGAPRRRLRRPLALVGLGLVVPASLVAVALAARAAVLDSTLVFTEASGAVLGPLTAAALGGLLGLTAAALFVSAAAVLIARATDARRRWTVPVVGAFAATAAAGLAVDDAPLAALLGLVALAVGLARLLSGREERWAWPVTFRGILLGTLALAPFAYGLLAGPVEERTDALLGDAARAFADARDSRLAFGTEQILSEARADDALRPALLEAIAYADSARVQTAAGLDPDSLDVPPSLDDLAAGLVSGSLLGSLADVAAELRLVGPLGDTLGSAIEGGGLAPPARDPLSFDSMRVVFERSEGAGFVRRSMPVEGRRGLSRTASIGPLLGADGAPQAWVYVRTSPRPSRFATETPFPRVLAPQGLFGLDDEALTYAEYDDGARVRARGEAAPLRLPAEIYDRLDARASAVVRTERGPSGPVRVMYDRIGEDARDVVVVQTPAPDALDVLFALLRITLAGLSAGLVLFLLGLAVRSRADLLSERRSRFRDKVLNRFLVVGLASVALTGAVGTGVIGEQNRQAVRDLLQQRLLRAEAALARDAEAEPGGDALDAARADAVAADLGVDVHLYDGADLLGSSRRQLVRQRLIEPRLPADVYRALFLDAAPYAFATTTIGSFEYTTGYKVLPDTLGRPAGAIAVPTLSEQAAIEAGRTRMVAMLFGGLLALLVAIVVLAALLAGQLTRPFGRLRTGLEAVGAGGTQEPIPVETHDEVGELVETFNAMQAQLAESRRRLAEQERDLAWSEMARQVAHEIKNPLMPMKLSVQHLQRVHRPPPDDATPGERKFSSMFERTTGMLIDQIETLNRIASDFSSFARLPMRAPETLDLSDVASEAAALFEGPLLDSGRAELDLDLGGEIPVVADRDELRRVFVNLLTNALQAIPTDRPGRIRFSTRADAGSAVALVTDNGTGIDAEAQARVFQPSFSTKTSGMGLGLAISRRAVEAAGGTIAFATTVGEGTTFTVRLPMA